MPQQGHRASGINFLLTILVKGSNFKDKGFTMHFDYLIFHAPRIKRLKVSLRVGDCLKPFFLVVLMEFLTKQPMTSRLFQKNGFQKKWPALRFKNYADTHGFALDLGL